MTQQDDVIALRQRLLACGFQPIAVRSFAKNPVGLAWQAMTGMPKYDKDAASTGILCGEPRGVDLDIDDEAAATVIAAMIAANFGPAPTRVRSNSPRCLLVYRCAGPPRPKRVIPLSCGKVELLGRGQMFVGYGGHPSGAAYTWRGASLDETPLEDLRTISEEQEDALEAALLAHWPVSADPEGETAAKRPNGASEPRSGGKADFRNTCLVEDVEAALDALPNDYDRAGWVKIGMAAHAGNASYDAFDRWSRKWPGYDEKATRTAWASFSKAHSVTEASLFAETFRRIPGWKKPSERDTGEAGPAEEDWEDEGDAPGAGSADARSGSAPKGALPFTLFDEVDISGRKSWILKGVLARGETSTWIAPPGKLKSALLTELAVHVAAGWAWRGHLNKERCGVVYLALERGDLIKRRLAAYRARFDLVGLPIAVVSRTINLMDPQCVAAVLATIKAVEARVGQSVGLVVIDTIAKGIAAGGGDEDKAKDKDKGRAFAHLRQVQEGANVHLGIVGHTGKDEDRGSRGSNADLGDADMQVQIRGEATKYADVIKANDRPEGSLVSFRGLLHDFGPDEDGDPVSVNILDPEVLEANDRARAKAGAGSGLPKSAQIALNALCEALSEMGTTAPASNHIPAKALSITIEDWRRYAYLLGISAGEDRAKQRAFRRAVESLVAAKRVGIWGAWVWIV